MKGDDLSENGSATEFLLASYPIMMPETGLCCEIRRRCGILY